MNRDFKGVWIPKEIWLNQEMSIIEKCLVVEIDSLDSSEKGCFASNEYLGRFIGVSEGRCANIISDLKKRNILIQSYFDGRVRALRLHENVKSALLNDSRNNENVKAEITKTCDKSTRNREPYLYIDNTSNNTNNINTSEKSEVDSIDDFFKKFSKEQIEDFTKRNFLNTPPPVPPAPPKDNSLFNEWWGVWRKKVGKEKAMKKFNSLKESEQREVIEHSKQYMAVVTDVKYICDTNKYLSNKFYREPDFIASRDFRQKSVSTKKVIAVRAADDETL